MRLPHRHTWLPVGTQVYEDVELLTGRRYPQPVGLETLVLSRCTRPDRNGEPCPATSVARLPGQWTLEQLTAPPPPPVTRETPPC